ncbi:LysR family transcriptional regulator [Litorilituus lipolyticus]|uniref:LysR family transcriptional regulator n=1 Tax=Litorilituus lipolyticus TaxID=2491017 RepID=A0A502KLL5_9GAMM|nr:LysR family transcriptional regulator [Litorilituus lipolyticus]TPH12500.1 LysR family transcriptional regulator [Litorilituus lipolyticus]
MNWDDLKFFLAVSRCGTISGAAKQFNVQHSTVSRRIKALEHSLGVSLLKRTNNAYELTVQGAKIEQAAKRMESEITCVDGMLVGKEDSLVGPLRITTISSMSSGILMPIFSSFCKTHPHIDLHVASTSEAVSLTNREADIAIRLTNTPPEMLIGKRVVTVASTIYGNIDYLKELSQTSEPFEWIGAKCCHFHDTWTKQSCKEKTHLFSSDDALTILSAVKAGLGVTFLPCFIGDAEPLLARYVEPKADFDLGLWVLIHPELKQNARVVAFKQHLIKAINNIRHTLEGC